VQQEHGTVRSIKYFTISTRSAASRLFRNIGPRSQSIAHSGSVAAVPENDLAQKWLILSLGTAKLLVLKKGHSKSTKMHRFGGGEGVQPRVPERIHDSLLTRGKRGEQIERIIFSEQLNVIQRNRRHEMHRARSRDVRFRVPITCSRTLLERFFGTTGMTGLEQIE